MRIYSWSNRDLLTGLKLAEVEKVSSDSIAVNDYSNEVLRNAAAEKNEGRRSIWDLRYYNAAKKERI